MANLLKESASSHIITVHGVIHPSLSLWNISSKEIRKSITLFIIPDQGMVILVRLKFTPLPIPIEKDIRFKELMTSKWKILRAESYSRKGWKPQALSLLSKADLVTLSVVTKCTSLKRMRITLWQLSYWPYSKILLVTNWKLMSPMKKSTNCQANISST